MRRSVGGSRDQIAGYNYAPVEIGALEIATQSAQPTLANLTLTNNITGVRFGGSAGTIPTVIGSTFSGNTNGVPRLPERVAYDNGQYVHRQCEWRLGGEWRAAIAGGAITTSAGKRSRYSCAPRDSRAVHSGNTVSSRPGFR